jgi:hypothetical protein
MDSAMWRRGWGWRWKRAASSDAVIAEAKPRTLRKRRLCLLAGGRGRAVAARDDALILPLLRFPASSIYSLTRIAYLSHLLFCNAISRGCVCHILS